MVILYYVCNHNNGQYENDGIFKYGKGFQTLVTHEYLIICGSPSSYSLIELSHSACTCRPVLFTTSYLILGGNVPINNFYLLHSLQTLRVDQVSVFY